MFVTRPSNWAQTCGMATGRDQGFHSVEAEDVGDNKLTGNLPIDKYIKVTQYTLALMAEKKGGLMKFVSLRDTAQAIGSDTYILLETEEVAQGKIAAGKAHELWVFDQIAGVIRRGDNKFHACGVVPHPGGWYVAAVIEEPSVVQPEYGPRIVGQVIVDVNQHGFVRSRIAKGLNGEILELRPSSISKGELESSGRKPDAVYEANPQRIKGTIAVFRNDVDFPDEEGVTPSEFVSRSTDARSITAIAKLGLLS